MKIRAHHLMVAVALILLSLAACTPGQDIVSEDSAKTYEVTIKVVLADDSKFYVIEEIPPADATVIDKGLFSIDASGHLKYVEFQQAENYELTYKIEAKPDSVFSGQYSIDGVTQDVTDILGASRPGSERAIDASSPGAYRIITSTK